jgi:guanylate kinase
MTAENATENASEGSGLLVVVSGPSGVGKTTITRALRERFPEAEFSVSATTRPRTEKETEGVDYHFLSEEEFVRRIEEGAFLEHVEYAGKRYGTLREPVEDVVRRGGLMILDIDVRGGESVKAALPSALAMFILPPSEEELLRRLRDRKRESEEQIQKRFSAAKAEIARAKSSGAYEAMIVNDQLDEAVERAIRLVEEAREIRASA